MSNFFDRLSYRMAHSMENRNGMDTLARYSFGLGVILMVVDFFIGSGIVSLLSTICLIYALFRCYSKNIASRALENAKFERLIRKPQARAREVNRHWEQRKTTKFFTCSSCGQKLSVPKGKGTLRVTCPKCGNQTTIKS